MFSENDFYGQSLRFETIQTVGNNGNQSDLKLDLWELFFIRESMFQIYSFHNNIIRAPTCRHIYSFVDPWLFLYVGRLTKQRIQSIYVSATSTLPLKLPERSVCCFWSRYDGLRYNSTRWNIWTQWWQNAHTLTHEPIA